MKHIDNIHECKQVYFHNYESETALGHTVITGNAIFQSLEYSFVMTAININETKGLDVQLSFTSEDDKSEYHFSELGLSKKDIINVFWELNE